MNRWYICAAAIFGSTVATFISTATRPHPTPFPPCECPAAFSQALLDGTIEAELGTGDSAITLRVSGDAVTVLASPGTGKKWILLPVKGEN